MFVYLLSTGGMQVSQEFFTQWDCEMARVTLHGITPPPGATVVLTHACTQLL
jgi:hypothetical protein